jgi:hypothetical protein
MEGGIAILLLLIIFVIALVLGAAMYFTGGALWFSRTGDENRRERFNRPKHKRVSSETIENTEVVGTRRDDES